MTSRVSYARRSPVSTESRDHCLLRLFAGSSNADWAGAPAVAAAGCMGGQGRCASVCVPQPAGSHRVREPAGVSALAKTERGNHGDDHFH